MRIPLALLLSLTVAACSSASDPAPSGDLPVTVESASGSLRIVLAASSSGPPAVGTNTIELTVTRASDGAAVEGLHLDVVPWMPAMDHGTSAPTLTDEGGGKFLVSNLYFYMAGVWELKTTFSGPVTDHAEPQFQVQ